MNWDGVIETIADAAPLLGKLLPIPGAGIAGTLIASAFGTKNDPASIAAAIAADPNAAMKLKELEENNRAALAEQLVQAETKRISEVNRTIRAEVASNDAYVRRWRPTFGYAVAITWVMTSFAVMWAILFAPDKAYSVASLISALVPMWGIALTVLGVNVAKRSKDKAVAAGQTPKGAIETVLNMVGGKRG